MTAPEDETASGASTPALSLRARFWWLVAVFNAALLALGLGLLLVIFDRRAEFGWTLIAAGALLAAYGYWSYRRVGVAAD